MEPFSANFEKLIGLYPSEFERYRLDEIVVAAIAPIVSSISCALKGRSLLYCATDAPLACSVAATRRAFCIRVELPFVETRLENGGT